MSEYLLRQRLAQCHQENRPVDRMEPDDILADQVQVCGPQLLILFGAVAVCIVADTGDVVGQRIQPYIDDMLGIEGHRNPPGEGSTGYAQILQSGEQEVVHHLVLTGNGLNELGMLINVLDQFVCIFAHAEEISLLLGRLYDTAAVRALAVHQLGLRPEGFTGSTVHSLVSSLIDVPLIIETLEDLLYLLLMILIRGTDELIIGNVQQITQTADDTGDLIYMFLGCDAGCLSLQFDLLSMLVSTGLEEDIIALLSLETCDAVSQYDLVVVADMGLRRCIGNRCGKIIFSFAFHCVCSPFLLL